MALIDIVRREVVEVCFLKVECSPRYWEDAEVNEIKEVNDDPVMPFVDVENETWSLTINVDNGFIQNWPIGTTAKTHYKVCDAGAYYLLDADNVTVASFEDDYVPSILCPLDSGFGDYIILDIDENGQIKGWDSDIDEFQRMLDARNV